MPMMNDDNDTQNINKQLKIIILATLLSTTETHPTNAKEEEEMAENMNVCSSKTNLVWEDNNNLSSMVIRPDTRRWKNYCCTFFYFTIPEGYYGLVTRHGARIDYIHPQTGKHTPVWPCGLHYAPPWVRVSHLITKQDVVFQYCIDACYSHDNVSCDIDLSIVLRVMGNNDNDEDDSSEDEVIDNNHHHPPDMDNGSTTILTHPTTMDHPQNVVKFVNEVTPMGLQAQLQSIVTSNLRSMVRSLHHTHILTGLQQQCRHSNNNDIHVATMNPTTTIRESTRGIIHNQQIEEYEGGTNKKESNDETSSFSSAQVILSFDTDNAHINATTTTTMNNNDVSEKRSNNVNPTLLLVDKLKFRLNQQLTHQGIEVVQVVIQKITFPPILQSQLTNQTILQRQREVQILQHQLSMQMLLHEEERKNVQQTCSLKENQLRNEYEHDTHLVNLQLETLRATNDSNLQSISTQMSIDVGLVRVENQYTQQRIVDESALESEKIRIQSKAYGDIELANTESNVQVLLAKTECEVMKNVVKASKALRCSCHGLTSIVEMDSENTTSAAASSAVAANTSTTNLLISPRNVMDLGGNCLLWEEEEEGGGGGVTRSSIVPYYAVVQKKKKKGRAQSLPDKRTLDRQRVLDILAERQTTNK